MLAAEKHKGTFLAPLGIGLALFIAEMSGTSDLPWRSPLFLANASQVSTTPAAP